MGLYPSGNYGSGQGFVFTCIRLCEEQIYMRTCYAFQPSCQQRQASNNPFQITSESLNSNFRWSDVRAKIVIMMAVLVNIPDLDNREHYSSSLYY
jgi:hypothetical protein